jgi:hypothetical protein
MPPNDNTIFGAHSTSSLSHYQVDCPQPAGADNNQMVWTPQDHVIHPIGIVNITRHGRHRQEVGRTFNIYFTGRLAGISGRRAASIPAGRYQRNPDCVPGE